MRHTISTVQYTTSSAARGLQRQHILNCSIHCGYNVYCKHNCGHFLAVYFRIQRSFCQHYRVLFMSHPELVVECMVPNLLHIIPISDNTVFNWVFERQKTTLGLRFVSDVAVFFPMPSMAT